MSRVLWGLVLIALLLALGYYLLSIVTLSPAPVPPVASEEPALPASPPENTPPALNLSPAQKKAAKSHLQQLTEQPQQPIEAKQARHFVTADQLIQLPVTETENSAALLDNDHTGARSFGVDMGSFRPGSSTPARSGNSRLPGSNTPLNSHQVRLNELLDLPAADSRHIFYIHAVNKQDEQGLWGILQQGLTATFAKGLVLPEGTQAVQAHIPAEADELLANRRSSYLGKLLHNKVNSTYIYNYQQGLLGQSPDLIQPGQQLVIVTFTENELLRIYQHFTQE